MGTSPSGGRKGVRKDAISHGLYAMVHTRYGTMEKYFLHLDKIMPGKPADMIAKYIPSEIEQTTKVTHDVLVVNMPEPRQLSRDVKELEPIDVECEDADRGDPLFNRIKHDTELDSNDLASRED